MKALIFDCDGVLVDTERDGHRVAFNRAFAARGYGVAEAIGVDHARKGGNGGADGQDIDLPGAQGGKHGRGDPGTLAKVGAKDRDDGYVGALDDSLPANLVAHLLQEVLGVLQLVLRDAEHDLVVVVDVDALYDKLDVDAPLAQGRHDLAGDARPVRDGHHAHLGQARGLHDAADLCLGHGFPSSVCRCVECSCATVVFLHKMDVKSNKALYTIAPFLCP